MFIKWLAMGLARFVREYRKAMTRLTEESIATSNNIEVKHFR